MNMIGPLLRLRSEGLVENRPVNGEKLSLRLAKGPSVHSNFALITRHEMATILVPEADEVSRIFRGPLHEAVATWRNILDLVHPGWHAHVDGNKRIKIRISQVEKNSQAFEQFYQLVKDVLSGGS